MITSFLPLKMILSNNLYFYLKPEFVCSSCGVGKGGSVVVVVGGKVVVVVVGLAVVVVVGLDVVVVGGVLLCTCNQTKINQGEREREKRRVLM